MCGGCTPSPTPHLEYRAPVIRARTHCTGVVVSALSGGSAVTQPCDGLAHRLAVNDCLRVQCVMEGDERSKGPLASARGAIEADPPHDGACGGRRYCGWGVASNEGAKTRTFVRVPFAAMSLQFARCTRRAASRARSRAAPRAIPPGGLQMRISARPPTPPPRVQAPKTRHPARLPPR